MRSTSYMTAAHYEAYGVIDELEAEVSRVRRQIERDWRGKIITVNTGRLSVLFESLDDAMCKWHEEDENAPTVDAASVTTERTAPEEK